MLTLVEEIIAALPALTLQFPNGPTARDVSAAIAASYSDVLAATAEVKASGRAIVARYPGEKARRFLPAGHDLGIRRAACPVCDLIFQKTVRSKRVCCGRSCAVSLSWTKPGVREAKLAGIRAERATPHAKERLAAHNKRRWSRPGEREKMSEQNRREWADPAKKSRRSAGIQRANGNAEKRQLASDIRRAFWNDPESRAKMVAGIKRSKSTPEARALFSKLLSERWKDPEMRAKYTAANRARNDTRRGESLRRYLENETPEQAVVRRMAAANSMRGRKQSPETIRKRVETTKRRRAERKK